MKFNRFENVHEFAEKAEPVLAEREDVYSLFFGVLQALNVGSMKIHLWRRLKKMEKCWLYFK